MLYFRCVKSVNHGTELVRELKNEFGKKSMLTTIDGNLVVVTEFDSNKMCERPVSYTHLTLPTNSLV